MFFFIFFFFLNDTAPTEIYTRKDTLSLHDALPIFANYAFTDRASAAVRGEWFEDHGGARTGLRGTVYEATVTGKYLITQHLYGQLEYRHDESAKGDAFPKDSPGRVNGSTGPIPITKFTDGQDILGFNVTYVFN